MPYREGPQSILSHNGKHYSVDKLMDAGEDGDHDIPMHQFSEAEALPFVLGENFIDCITKLEEILRKASFDDFREIKDLFGNFYYMMFDRSSGIDRDELLAKVKAFKEKLDKI